MALQDITTKILDDAQKEAAQIAQRASDDAARIASDAQAAKKAQERATDQETERVIEQRERTALSRARREAQQIVTNAKRAAIDAVVADARTQMVDADDALYTQFVQSLLATVPAEARAAMTEIRVPAARRAVSEKCLADAGFAAPIVEDAQIAAGVVLVGTDADFDLTVDRVIADRMQDLEAHTATTLFGTHS